MSLTQKQIEDEYQSHFEERKRGLEPRELEAEHLGERLLETHKRLLAADPSVKLSEVGVLLGLW